MSHSLHRQNRRCMMATPARLLRPPMRPLRRSDESGARSLAVQGWTLFGLPQTLTARHR
jgi:hypothetical protein